MKTQLLEDFALSGSAPAAPRPEPARQGGHAGTPRPAAVWRRPQAIDATWPNIRDTVVPAPEAPVDADKTWVPGPDATARRTAGFAEPAAPLVGGAPAPAQANEVPAWLAQRLREESEHEAALRRKRLWTRRALAWGGAATVLAMLAAGGAWLYQESRDEGALVVVANTSPARGGTRGLAGPPLSAPAADATVPARTRLAPGAVAVPTLPIAAGRTGATPPLRPTGDGGVIGGVIGGAKDPGSPVAGGVPLESGLGTSSDVKAATPDGVADPGKPTGPAAKHTGVTAALPNWRPASVHPAPPADAGVERTSPARPGAPRKAGAPVRNDAAEDVIDAPAAAAAQAPHARPSRQRHADARTHANAPARAHAAPTRAQRREETLMQCRVLGYDERQCLRRGCEMTRFGLACKG